VADELKSHGAGPEPRKKAPDDAGALLARSNLESPLPGKRAPEGLVRKIHMIGPAVERTKIVAAEIIIDVLQPTEKISGECVLDTRRRPKNRQELR
jgi:hypothetical protein